MLGTRATHTLVRLLLAIAAGAVTPSWLWALFLFPGALVGQEPDKTKPAPFDILVIAPHPDDEAIGCAAVMLRALRKKQRVGVVLVTNGDGYPQAAATVAKKPEARLEPADFLRLARIRQQHSVGALSKIGVLREDLISLGYPDSGLKAIYESKGGKPYKQPFTGKAETYAAVIRDYHTLAHGRAAAYTRASVLADLEEIIKARRPREVYVTSKADAHPDHRATFWFVRDAARAAGYRRPLFTFVVHGKPPVGPAHRVVLTEAEQGRKRAILKEYQTKLSPVHDDLARKFTREEELFWPVRIE
jgi:LmbE family N-acetylglucosaminyl deacetylase